MKILLATNKPESPSFIFYSECMRELDDPTKGQCFEMSESIEGVDYKQYDVVLFMGGSNGSKSAKLVNKDIICGIVDPRDLAEKEFTDMDIVIANGIESQIFFSKGNCSSIIYPVYPRVPAASPVEDKGEIILGYHGNKMHLEAMVPRVTDAIRKLNESVPVKLYAMYNSSGLGESTIVTTRKLGFPVQHIQYSHENYSKYMSACDIGLVPQLMFEKRSYLNRLFDNVKEKLRGKSVNYRLNFKATTNLGRHFVFCQYKIPLVTDITPSSSSFINQGINGFMGYSSDNWYQALYNLSVDAGLRRTIGSQGYEDWLSNYSHDVLNENLVLQLEKMISRRLND